jgi:hypothetical protein
VQNKFVVLKSMSGTWATFKHTNLCQYTTENEQHNHQKKHIQNSSSKIPKRGQLDKHLTHNLKNKFDVLKLMYGT